MSATIGVPLWRQLQLVARLVRGVREGRSLPAQLDEIEIALRPGVQALSFHVLRWLGLAQVLGAQLARRTPPPAVDALLCTCLALAHPADAATYDAFTLVNQAVEAAKRDRVLQSQAAFINACLRRFLRERHQLMTMAMRDPVARWNHSRWWIERLQRDHPNHWRAILTASQNAAPMDLRVNVQRSTVADFCARLSEKGIGADALGGVAVRLHRPLPVREIPGFADGHFSVQSFTAQRAATLLLGHCADLAAPLVLDACAAPGGKTAHLLECCPDARVTALEVEPVRKARIDDNLGRLGLHADVRVVDAGDVSSWWSGEYYDAVLLDAPCSASGIVSRHPDVRWLRRESDIAQMALQQDRLLHALWPLVKPGGRLLYCTCSVFVQEGTDRIQAFVAHHSNAALLGSPGHLLPSPGGAGGAVGDNTGRDDGFYYALLGKRPG